jgi:dihydroorotate dehydrogenase
VINISSPNTVGLRELSQRKNLEPLLRGLRLQLGQQRLLLKLSPDMEATDLKNAVQIASEYVDGFVLTNTTVSREPGSPFPKEGGLSGRPLAELSEQALKTVKTELGANRQKYLIVSVGGVLNAADVQRRLDLGADLVEVYSALIFEGPWFFRQVAAARRDIQ